MTETSLQNKIQSSELPQSRLQYIREAIVPALISNLQNDEYKML